MVNDFEKSVFPKYPVIVGIKETLYEKGAVYASMSGSGSSVFGLFREATDLKSLFADWFCLGGTTTMNKIADFFDTLADDGRLCYQIRKN